jgi:chromosomal replication initiator protein
MGLSPYAAVGIRPNDLPGKVYYAPEIIAIVMDYKKVSLADLKARTRVRNIVYARHLCMFLLRKKIGSTWKELGLTFGGRDHTSAMHGYNLIKDLYDVDEIVQKDVNYLLTII